MDPGSSAGRAIAAADGAVLELPGAPERFGALLDARDRTTQRLEDLRERIASLALPSRTALVLFGSWGRAEVTDDSDVDWALVVDDPDLALDDPVVTAAAADVREILDGEGARPGRQAIFGVPFHAWRLVEHVGLADDDAANVTRRMLLLLESVPVTGPDIHAVLKRRVLERYLSRHARSHRPPRFLLNDVIRYWRTIGVDFEGKLAQDLRAGRGEDKYVMRNAKLRTSRKLLYYSGLLPVLLCHYVAAQDMADFLGEQFDALATDRVARAFLHLGESEAGSRALRAYDDWIALMADAGKRAHLGGLTDATHRDDATFARIRQLGGVIENATLGLLYETDFGPVARRFLTT